MNTSIIKPSAIVLFFLILAILNGFIATLGLFLSIYTLCKFRSDEYSPYQYFLATTSLILTIMPFVLIGLTKAEGKEEKGTLNVYNLATFLRQPDGMPGAVRIFHHHLYHHKTVR